MLLRQAANGLKNMNYTKFKDEIQLVVEVHTWIYLSMNRLKHIYFGNMVRYILRSLKNE